MIKAIIFDCFGVLTGIDNSTTNEVLFEYIRDKLKPNYKIGMLSNAEGNLLDKLFEKWQVDLLDEVALSYQIKTAKPELLAYQTISEQLGVLPEECIFVDDLIQYCSAAEQAGMKAIYFTDNQQTIVQIEHFIRA